MSHYTAIVLAAGAGSRMKSDVPKQFLPLSGKPVLFYSLNTFDQSPVDDIIVVTGEDRVEYVQNEIVDKYGIKKVKKIVCGGSERYLSVKNALDAASPADYVLIHDAARPFITARMIEESMQTVKEFSACTVGVPAKDTIKVVDKDLFGVDTPDRRTLYQVQTPQSFDYKKLLKAYELLAKSNDTDVTDDTMIVERYLGLKVKLIEGDYTNIKITTPEDLDVALIFQKALKIKA